MQGQFIIRYFIVYEIANLKFRFQWLCMFLEKVCKPEEGGGVILAPRKVSIVSAMKRIEQCKILQKLDSTYL